MNSRVMLLVRYCISIGVIMLAALTSPAFAAGCKLGVLADLPVTMEEMRASVPVKVNGKDTRFWLDSGAFFNLMPKAKASELGLKTTPLPYWFYLTGVGGTASAELATIKSFNIVGHELRNVQFLVGGSDAGNGLIGRNLLGIADTEFDLAHGSVKLIKPFGCKKGVLAYWASGKIVFSVPLKPNSNSHDHSFRLPVSINGAEIDAEFDTGSPTSLISRRAAKRAGIDLSGAGVTPVSELGGLGRHFAAGWIVPVKNFSIGGEQILRTHLEVIDGPIFADAEAPDMLLGADFMLAHHIYVARGQRRIYFTYSGGEPFMDSPPATDAAKAAAPALPPGTHRVQATENPAATPKTAGEFARRGSARLAEHALPKAIADFSKAIRFAPEKASYYRDRAKAYVESDQPQLARADIDKALKLDPNDGELLQVRAFMRLASHDKAGALADAEAALRATPPASLKASNIAILFQRLHQPDRSIAIFDAVIAAHRDDAALGGLLNGRCWMRALANVELDKALKDCDKAIKRDGEKAEYLDSRGSSFNAAS